MKIASVHYDEVKLDRSQYGGFYVIPAVAKGAPPEFLIITNKTQTWQTVVSHGKQIRRETITDKEIALDCIRAWTLSSLGVSPQCHPGIWIVREEIAMFKPFTRPDGETEMRPQLDAENKQVFRPATREECDEMFAEDLAREAAADLEYAELMFAQANEWWNSPNPKDRRFISPHHKKAAKHLGKDADWLKSGSQLDVKGCVFCTKMVPINAIKCPHCNEVIDAVEYARRKQELKEATDAVRPPQEPKFACSDCGKKFNSNRELVQHRVNRADCVKEDAALSKSA